MSSPRNHDAYPPIVLVDQLAEIEHAGQRLADYGRIAIKNLPDHPRPASLPGLPGANAVKPPEARLRSAIALLADSDAALQQLNQQALRLPVLEKKLDDYVSRRIQRETAERLSRRNFRIGLFVTVLLLIIAGIVIWWGSRQEFPRRNFADLPPSGPSAPGGFIARETELAAFLGTKVPEPFIRITHVKQTSSLPNSEDHVTIVFEATGSVLQTLVEPVDTAAGLKAAGINDSAQIASDFRIALSPVAERLRELGHLGAIPPNPLDTKFVRIVTEAGTTVPYAGTLHARRSSGRS